MVWPILPETGTRFTWQSNTFMNTETRKVGTCGRSSSGGGRTVAMRFTRPSAGETTSPSATGVTRSGSRKK